METCVYSIFMGYLIAIVNDNEIIIILLLLHDMKNCHNGICFPRGSIQLGQVDVQILRGEFNLIADYFVAVCIRNSSETLPVSLNEKLLLLFNYI